MAHRRDLHAGRPGHESSGAVSEKEGPSTLSLMVKINDIEYVADDTLMLGCIAVPDGDAQRPAVLIAHEGNSPNWATSPSRSTITAVGARLMTATR